MKRLLLLFGILLVAAIPARANTLNAASCSYSDVSSAYSSASSGDTVLLPSCSSTDWGANRLTISKAITLEGATTCTGRGQTLSCTAGTTITGSGTLIIVLSNNVRVTGLTLNNTGTGSTAVVYVGDETSTTSYKGWRIDDIVLSTGGGTERGIITYGLAAGVIDHVWFNQADGGINVWGANGENNQYAACNSLGVDCYGTHSWQTPMTLGDGNAVYIEDCHFNFTSASDGAYDNSAGGRSVFRFNYVSGTYIGTHGLDSGGHRSVLREEIYDNTFIDTAGNYLVYNSRGGVVMMFSNTVSASGTSYGDFVWLQNYRSNSAQAFSPCDGTDSIDQDTSGQQGYACRDQVGRGPTTNANEWPVGTVYSEPLVPDYLWANDFKGSAPVFNKSLFVGDSSGQEGPGSRVYDYHIKINRDFYNQDATDCNTNGCTAGIGSGTLASAPSTCTNGTGWWATDKGGNWDTLSGNANDGALYVCSSNAWSLYYTPYTYPNPLQGSQPSASGPPAPAGLTAVVQ